MPNFRCWLGAAAPAGATMPVPHTSMAAIAQTNIFLIYHLSFHISLRLYFTSFQK